MTLGLVTDEEESLTKQFTMLITLRCTLLGFRCVQYIRLNKEPPESKLE